MAALRRTPGGRWIPPGAYERYLGISLAGHPTNAQRAALYAAIDAAEEVPVPPAERPKRPPKPERHHVFIPGPADPAFVARVLHGRGCDCRYCVEARLTRRFA